ncbi:HAMP domain-containing sensor histidine kinase [Clostridium tertium]|uniref:sensor histidine kinase n=1 Tax=Clostridium tertium TaxID=1559 RepID=UPI0023314E52|nr:HAMP domain-containing sensor histidine kinase [Clostridium tertium]MDB1924015.1 HAMP domain-containing sensor histidine kinase [Clostridium tertium]MDB1927311.1 HAMP domain-containing sensor histidine kinase [Clostridium tertium]MDB1931087.1 HAMP domain-containing sensor histidine kinase [Clostridium tertium]
MIFDKNFCNKDYKIRWISEEENIKLKDINERVFIETFIGKILVFINYFVVRKLVNTTGEEFLPNYNTEGPKYIVLLTWIVFSVIVSISLLQLVLKSKIYKSQDIEGYERSFYKGKLFNKFIKITISIIFYITLYQIIFQLTMKEINIKSTILWWIIILNILVLCYLGISILKNNLIVENLNSILDETIKSLENGSFDKVYDLLNENQENYVLFNGMDLNILNRAIKELISISKRIENNEATSNVEKVELITNVSHDLRTPLTSIINYVDFLSRGKLTENNKKEYIDILERKAKRIKVLIGDLKESIMANSNNIALDIREVDLRDVLDHVLFELEDKIREFNLKFNIKVFFNDKEVKSDKYTKIIVYADYDKTLRIYQNIISNIIKYSVEGSEVFIVFEYYYNKVDKISNTTFINESAEKIELNEKELLERFKRGDTSRTAEGSGLGLDIAKSLTEAQNGKFKIEIRGNKFIVNVLI